MQTIISNNPEESRKFAQGFAEKILRPMSRSRLDIEERGGALVLALTGDLGSGKTVFAQAFAESLGVKEKIKSPTFIIFRKSEIHASPASSAGKSAGKQNLFKYFYHFDVYRINEEKEVLNLGWEEIISNPKNIVLVEWADKIEKILPKNRVKINFKHLKGDKREIIFS